MFIVMNEHVIQCNSGTPFNSFWTVDLCGTEG